MRTHTHTHIHNLYRLPIYVTYMHSYIASFHCPDSYPVCNKRSSERDDKNKFFKKIHILCNIISSWNPGINSFRFFLRTWTLQICIWYGALTLIYLCCLCYFKDRIYALLFRFMQCHWRLQFTWKLRGIENIL